MYINHSELTAPHPRFTDARRQLRQRVSASVEVHTAAFGCFQGRLVDLSIDGCRVRSDTQFAPGTPVTLSIAGGYPVPAVIIWSRGNNSGLRFGAIDHRAIVQQLLDVLGD